MEDYRSPVAPRLTETLNGLARAIDAEIPSSWGFTLFLFDGEHNNTVWVSSVNRDTLVNIMREFVRKQSS